MRPRNIALLLAGIVLCGLTVRAVPALYASRKDGLPLAVRWEGAFIDHNFRDVGASLNGCLGRKVFAEQVLLRANVWFSGWSCDDVGNPDVIYSLNHAKERDELYFCRGDAGNVVGRFFNPEVTLSDLEFLETWKDPRMVQGACGFIVDGLTSIASGKRVLVHCDAGQDRTGTYSALAGALAAEAKGLLDAKMLDALECDYQRTVKLAPEKHGRMQRFISTLQMQGGVAAFLASQCGLDARLVAAASERLLPGPAQPPAQPAP